MGLLEKGHGDLRVGHLHSSLCLPCTQMWAASAEVCQPKLLLPIPFLLLSSLFPLPLLFFLLLFFLPWVVVYCPIPSAQFQAITSCVFLLICSGWFVRPFLGSDETFLKQCKQLPDRSKEAGELLAGWNIGCHKLCLQKVPRFHFHPCLAVPASPHP